MSTSSSLTLYSEHDSPLPDHDGLVAYLESIGLVGKSCGPERYLSGPQFFQYITFLGCAPNLTLDPAEGDDYLRLDIPRLSRPILHTGKTSRAPLCPDCRTPIADWAKQLAGENDGNTTCGTCSARHPITALNLRKRACYSACIIQIAPVFESEAVPSQALLSGLNRAFDSRFGYAYINTSN